MFLFSKCKDMGNTAQSFPFLSIFIINLRKVPFILTPQNRNTYALCLRLNKYRHSRISEY